jgi:hypothetical protein
MRKRAALHPEAYTRRTTLNSEPFAITARPQRKGRVLDLAFGLADHVQPIQRRTLDPGPFILNPEL